MTAVAPATPTATPPSGPTPERIGVLDVLRGIALLGMFLVHFNDQAVSTAGGLSALYQQAVDLLFEERFWAMFGILFGAGFALQLRRADARGASFLPMYGRRLLALAGFGLFAHAVFGYHVLFEYAAWGLPLLLIRRWSLKALMVAAVISAMSWSIFSVARGTYAVSTIGGAAYAARLSGEAASNAAFRSANQDAQSAPRYGTVFKARLQHIAWFYMQPYSFLPVNTFTLFLLGVLGLRVGVFDRPREYLGLIIGMMVFGIVSWAVATWLLPAPVLPNGSLSVRDIAVAQLKGGFGVIRTMWLTFAYIGAVLLLVSHNKEWLRRLAPFAWTGRMALTNYLIQIAILDLAFATYAMGLHPSPLRGLAAALGLFGIDAVFSRWWLSRFRFGPAEWLWRSVTYGRWQPLALPRAAELGRPQPSL